MHGKRSQEQQGIQREEDCRGTRAGNTTRRVEGNKKSEQGIQREEEKRGTSSQSRELKEKEQKRGTRSQSSREYKEKKKNGEQRVRAAGS